MANVLSDGISGASDDIVDDRDSPDVHDDDIVLLAMASKKGEAFVSTSHSTGRPNQPIMIMHGWTLTPLHSISPVVEYLNPASLRQLKTPDVICVANNDTLLATAVGNMPLLFNVGDAVRKGVVTNIL